MTFELFHTLDGMGWYGHIPQAINAPAGSTEVYQLEDSDFGLLNRDFIDPVNDLCDTLLDDGDVDFFDAKKCALLIEWLEDRLKKPCPNRLREVYLRLLDYAKRAVELGTGVVVEL